MVRRVLFFTSVLGLAVAFACGSQSGSPNASDGLDAASGSDAAGGGETGSADGGTAADGGASDGGPVDDGALGGDGATTCIVSTAACGPKPTPCVGDCRGKTCCSGLCAESICTDENIDFDTTCPGPCGGTPTGTWSLTGACATYCFDAGGRGAIAGSGTLVVGPNNATSITYGTDTRCNGTINLGNGHSIGGTWDPDAGTVGGRPYCVSGNTLWIHASNVDGAWVLKFTK